MRPSWAKSQAVPPTTKPSDCSAANAGTPFFGITVKLGGSASVVVDLGALATFCGGTPAATMRSSMCSTTACDCATTPILKPWSRTRRAITCEPT
jgi:hypothetical protein